MKPASTRTLLSLLIFLGGIHSLFAQNVLNPPGLYCIKSDTLFWTLPSGNTCGPFQSYLLYGSTSPGGPFNLITSVTNPSQTSYYHNTPPGQEWYYYMQTVHNCPGYIRLSSDTLSTAPPPRVPLIRATVLNGQVHLSWPPSNAPQVDRYIIYRNTPSGTIPIDTVFGGTTYIDAAADPEAQSEIYYVVASDPCGNNSLFDVLHQTIFLSSQVEECAGSIDLSWNPYINWTGGVERQEVWVSLNGLAAQPLATLPGDAVSYRLAEVDAQTSYCIAIRAFQQGSGIESRSNTICLTPDIIQPPRQLQIKYVSVNANQEPELEWIWETYAELDLAGIERSRGGEPWLAIQPIPVNPPLSGLNAFTDNGANAMDTRHVYRVFARDQCGQEWFSTATAPAWLRAFAQPGFRNELRWTPLAVDKSSIETHEVYELRGNLTLPLGQTADTFFIHELEAGRLPTEPVCYVVETVYRVDLPNGQERRFSRSNRACASQEVRLWMPNAFAPRGLNNSFRPLLVFADNADYELVVYNRWGGQVFRSTDQAEGWEGKIDGRDAPPGLYVWSLRLTTGDGQKIAERGTVMLLR
jgi:hypothetical protein